MAPLIESVQVDTNASAALTESTANNTDGLKHDRTPLQLICQGVCLPGIPRYPTFATHREWMLEKMALAFRLFARKGYTDGMAGHISVRDPEYAHIFWIVRTSFPARAI